MAKIARATQKIFASEADNNAVFGSLQAGNPQFSNDLAAIQSLDNFLQGWNSATISSEKLPALEDLQTLNYLVTTQLAYILSTGTPEWDSGTTYYKGADVKVINGSNYIIYCSLVDDNTGNDPSTTSGFWSVVLNTAASGTPVGSIVAYAASTAPEGWLICDGSEISRTTYADLFAVIGTTYGEGDGNTSFNLPTANDFPSGYPSKEQNDIQLEESGALYTAPANGFVLLNKSLSAQQFIELTTAGFSSKIWGGQLSQNAIVSIPVSKKQKYTASYSASGQTFQFVFTPDKGTPCIIKY